tara:strand:+ start:24 stop:782 length:759 start_codon:yes stop_codon:yes gene_type:complete
MNLFIKIGKKYYLLLVASVFFSLLISTYIFNQYNYFEKNHRINSEIVLISDDSILKKYIKDSSAVLIFSEIFFNKNNFNFWKENIMTEYEFYTEYSNIITIDYLNEKIILPSFDLIVSSEDYKIALLIKNYAEYIEKKFTEKTFLKIDSSINYSREIQKIFINEIKSSYPPEIANLIISQNSEKLFQYNMRILNFKTDTKFNNGKIITYREPFQFSRLNSNVSPLLLYFMIAISALCISFLLLAVFEELRRR